jgi:LuxR family maltose regulon positive regulatory protein
MRRVAGAVAPGQLRPPPLRPGIVERPRLFRRLDELTRAPLTVVAAPTGFGKTTLLAAWAAGETRPVAWASVGSHERDGEDFLALVAAALGRVEPSSRFDLRPGGRADDQAVVLATALGLSAHDLVLVVDGYERVTSSGVDAAFNRFLDLAPESLHVVVSARCEPGLSLPLRRSRGTVADLAASDLALDEDETAAVLVGTAGSGTAGADVVDLLERTGGWPAAVYLAALAARNAPHQLDTLARFSGAARDIADYLRLELLDAQPDDALRSFLLETSVLERLTPSLCDALLHRRDSEASLRALVRGGAFLVPLAGAGHEYRYLRPVAEFLRAELVRVAPERASDLQRRAAAVCERAGLVDEAAAHARLAGGDEDSVTLLARHALDLVRDGHTEHLERLLETRAGAAAARRRPALRAELRRLAGAHADVAALAAAAERVATLSAGLPGSPVRELLRSTAQAAEAYALLLSGRVAGAYEVGAAAHAAADTDAAAAAAQAAAVASLAAARLGLRAAAAPLSRASAAALSRRSIRTGTAAALAVLAEAAVAERQDEPLRAERLYGETLARADEAPPRALALLQLARLRGRLGGDARAALEEAAAELDRCEGASLLEALAAEVGSELASRQRRAPATGELSSAEHRVLRLLSTRLTQREIANELYVSPNTVKTHARVIYRKLGVGSRPAAVAAARELNLL